MDIEALKRTRDLIAAHPGSYDQALWAHECGTPACVAGFAVVANGGKLVMTQDDNDHVRFPLDPECYWIPQAAEHCLALTPEESKAMFAGYPMGGRSVSAKQAKQAIRMLNHAIETGEVVWQPEVSG